MVLEAQQWIPLWADNQVNAPAEPGSKPHMHQDFAKL